MSTVRVNLAEVLSDSAVEAITARLLETGWGDELLAAKAAGPDALREYERQQQEELEREIEIGEDSIRVSMAACGNRPSHADLVRVCDRLIELRPRLEALAEPKFKREREGLATLLRVVDALLLEGYEAGIPLVTMAFYLRWTKDEAKRRFEIMGERIGALT